MSTSTSISSATLKQVDAVCEELKPFLAEMIESSDPAVKNLTFDNIEARAAAVGDLLAKLLMKRALTRQEPITAAEEIAARQAALHKVSLKKNLS